MVRTHRVLRCILEPSLNLKTMSFCIGPWSLWIKYRHGPCRPRRPQWTLATFLMTLPVHLSLTSGPLGSLKPRG